MRCSAYCIGSSITTSLLFDYLKQSFEVKKFREVLYLKLPTPHVHEGDVFIFPYAALVCWGLELEQENNILSQIAPFVLQPQDTPCYDEFTYVYGSKANIVEDEIVVPDHEILTKLSFSHGISQSVKIDSFEQTIHKTIDVTRELPQHLATEGKIKLSRKQIHQMMGRLFIDRHSINLHQELLDTPEFFWEYSELEPIYKLTAHYLDRERRVIVLNQRLTVLKELFDMLSDEFNHKQSARLEWAVIWLIAIEVCLAFAKDIFHIL